MNGTKWKSANGQKNIMKKTFGKGIEMIFSGFTLFLYFVYFYDEKILVFE